ncbi:hypothetical protein HY637_04150 [Candidatus Woesearchaeota archaeon]|nr:hypothetical protein [Candidatus Woesearchaeota archaeon]
MAKTTITAEQLVQREDFNVDPVYEIIRRQKMDPQELSTGNIRFILKALREGSVAGLEEAVDRSELPDRLVLRFVVPNSKKELYVLATGKTHLDAMSSAQTYTLDDVLREFEGVAIVPTDPVVKKPSDGRPRTPTGPGKPPKPGKHYEAQIHAELFDYLRAHKHELVSELFSEPSDDSKYISHNTRLLRQILTPGLLAQIRDLGCEVDAMSLLGFMHKIVAKRNKRVRREVQEYLAGGKTFLHGFDYRQLQTIEQVPNAIRWVVQHRDDPSRDIAFYATCLSYLLRDKPIESKVKGRVVALANDYERARLHPISQRLPDKFTIDEYVTTATEEFLRNRGDYHQGTIVRLFQGFFVTERVKDCDRFVPEIMGPVAAANYLIVNFDDVNGIVKAAYQRIQQGEVREGTRQQYGKLYEQIVNRKFRLTPDSLEQLKRAVNANLTHKETAELGSMAQKGEVIGENYRAEIIRTYLMVKGKDLARR